MSILYKFLPSFIIDNVEKIRNINIFTKANTNITNLLKHSDVFILNKLKCNLFDNFNLSKRIKTNKKNIDIINKIFEGSNSNIITKKFYYNFNFLLNFNYSNVEYSFSGSNENKLYNFLKNVPNKRFYKFGLILFPLTFNKFVDSNNFINNIHRFLYTKNFNSYISCFISLFYYYFGLLASLLCMYKHDNIKVLDSNIIVIVCKLSSFVKILNSSYSNFYSNSVVNIKFLNIINNSLYLCKEKICMYRPYLIGVTKYVLTDNGILAKLSFQETLRFFKNIVLEHYIDWNVDSKSNIILSNFIPVGSGWYRYFCDK